MSIGPKPTGAVIVGSALQSVGIGVLDSRGKSNAKKLGFKMKKQKFKVFSTGRKFCFYADGGQREREKDLPTTY